MFEIIFYKDSNGKQPVKEYILSLKSKQDKSSKVKLNKIEQYLQILSTYGTMAGLPYLRKIEGKIWELRPLSDRIFFFYWTDNIFVLLHCFVKKTQKTPKREIEQAKNNMKDFIEMEGK